METLKKLKQNNQTLPVNQSKDKRLFMKFKTLELSKVLAALVLITVICISINNTQYVQAEQRERTIKMIKSHGFNVEYYEVKSQNYSLNVYRIVNPLADRKTMNKVPVICHTGILMDSTIMKTVAQYARPRPPNPYERLTLYRMENGTDDRSLFFYLSNNNYDVWLLDPRGIDFIKGNHNDKGRSYWDYSMDEEALIDLPNQINFILQITRQPRAAYIGFSQSTTFMFALLSMDPDFADKLVTFIALSPVVFVDRYIGILLLDELNIFGRAKTTESLFPRAISIVKNFFASWLCKPIIFGHSLCLRDLTSRIGFERGKSDWESRLTATGKVTTSMKKYEQFLRNHEAKDFRMYDYKDYQLNMKHYNQKHAPRYNVQAVKLETIVFFRGTKDFLSDVDDQAKLVVNLKVQLYEDHILLNYGHFDFFVGNNVVEDVNEPICRLLDKLTDRPLVSVSRSMVDNKHKFSPQNETNDPETQKQLSGSDENSFETPSKVNQDLVIG